MTDIKDEDSIADPDRPGALLICILAPVVEEIFFRGFMFGVFSRRIGAGLGRAARPGSSSGSVTRPRRRSS